MDRKTEFTDRSRVMLQQHKNGTLTIYFDRLCKGAFATLTTDGLALVTLKTEHIRWILSNVAELLESPATPAPAPLTSTGLTPVVVA